MLERISKLRAVSVRGATPMRMINSAQIGFINLHVAPDVTESVGACTLVIGGDCTCMQHPFAYTTQRLVTVPLDQATRERMINSQCLWIATSSLDRNPIGFIRWDGSELVYRGMHCDELHKYVWPLSEDPSVQCVVSAPIKMIENIYGGWLSQPYRMHACTRYHHETPLHKKICMRACSVASKHSSVAHMYAIDYVSKNVKLALKGALLDKMRAHMVTAVIENIEDMVQVYMPANMSDAVRLIRECAWVIQRIIMLGMMDRNCIWSRVPKDVCKLIHRMVFA